MALLPIVKKMDAALNVCDDKEKDRLENVFKGILSHYTKRVHDTFLRIFNVDFDFSSFPTAYGVPYFVPGDLKKGLSQTHLGA